MCTEPQRHQSQTIPSARIGNRRKERVEVRPRAQLPDQLLLDSVFWTSSSQMRLVSSTLLRVLLGDSPDKGEAAQGERLFSSPLGRTKLMQRQYCMNGGKALYVHANRLQLPSGAPNSLGNRCKTPRVMDGGSRKRGRVKQRLPRASLSSKLVTAVLSHTGRRNHPENLGLISHPQQVVSFLAMRPLLVQPSLRWTRAISLGEAPFMLESASLTACTAMPTWGCRFRRL